MKIIKYIYKFFFWSCFNLKYKSKIDFYSLGIKNKIGKFVFIRSGSELLNIEIGDYSYISGPRSYIEGVNIGKFCSIAREVNIGVSSHDYHWLTTSPVAYNKYYGFIEKDKKLQQKEIPIIKNDVWVGAGSFICRGVTIDNGAVICAGSVVTKNVPPYAIVAGVPAKIIKYRFNPEEIDLLLKAEWWNYDHKKLCELVPLMDNKANFMQYLRNNIN